MTLQAIGSSTRNGRLGLDLLYGSETQQSQVNLACSGAINACASGKTSICTVTFTLTKTTTVHISASGNVVVRVGSVAHQFWIVIDSDPTPPTFQANYPNAGGTTSGNFSVSLAAGAHQIENAYFTQSIGLFGCDTGNQLMTVSYTP